MKHKISFVLPALLLSFGLSACFPYHSRIPGVLDMRSDGMAAAPAPLPEESKAEKVEGGPRDGVQGFFLGSGMQSFGSRIVIEDRTYWLLWIFPMFNKSVVDEVNNASRGQALRQVQLQQEYAVNDVIIVFGAQLLNMVPVVGNVASLVAAVLTPSQTISLRGVRVDGGAVTNNAQAKAPQNALSGDSKNVGVTTEQQLERAPGESQSSTDDKVQKGEVQP